MLPEPWFVLPACTPIAMLFTDPVNPVNPSNPEYPWSPALKPIAMLPDP